jgi:phosphoribosylanthranilate isomerase
VKEAIAISGARAVDISSGVEKNRGEKSKSAISAFVHAAKLR